MNLGKHIIVDMFDIDIEKMKNINATEEKREFWEIFIKDCFNEGNITLLAQSWKDFDKEGAFTALYLLAESHLSIHTWPEHKYIALDVFTCGDADTQLIVDKIIEYFEPRNKKIITLDRGNLSHQNKREVLSKTSLDSSLYYLY